MDTHLELSDDLFGDVPTLPHTVEQLRKSLEHAEIDITLGHFTSSEDVFREIREMIEYESKNYQ